MGPVAKAYRGTGHETQGSDLLSVLKVLPIPEQVLGKERANALRAVKPDQWYPISQLMDVLDTLAQRLGDRALTPIGYSIVQTSHAVSIRKHFKTARQLLGAFDSI